MGSDAGGEGLVVEAEVAVAPEVADELGTGETEVDPAGGDGGLLAGSVEESDGD